MIRSQLRSTLFPYTTLFRSQRRNHCVRRGGRSSGGVGQAFPKGGMAGPRVHRFRIQDDSAAPIDCGEVDRKSTRLNSSHRTISYAVFCLKKKTKERTTQ